MKAPIYLIGLGLLLSPALGWANLGAATLSAAAKLEAVSIDCGSEKKEKQKECNRCKTTVEQEVQDLLGDRSHAVKQADAIEAKGSKDMSEIGQGSTGYQTSGNSSQDSSSRANAVGQKTTQQLATIARVLAAQAGQCPGKIDKACKDPGENAKKQADEAKSGCQDMEKAAASEAGSRAGQQGAFTKDGNKTKGNNQGGDSLNKAAQETKGNGGAGQQDGKKEEGKKEGGGGGGDQGGGQGGGGQGQQQKKEPEQKPNQAVDCRLPQNAGLIACVQYKQMQENYKQCLDRNAKRDVISSTCNKQDEPAKGRCINGVVGDNPSFDPNTPQELCVPSEPPNTSAQ